MKTHIIDFWKFLGLIIKTLKAHNLSEKNFNEQLDRLGLDYYIKTDFAKDVCDMCGMPNDNHDPKCWIPTDEDRRIANKFIKE